MVHDFFGAKDGAPMSDEVVPPWTPRPAVKTELPLDIGSLSKEDFIKLIELWREYKRLSRLSRPTQTHRQRRKEIEQQLSDMGCTWTLQFIW